MTASKEYEEQQQYLQAYQHGAPSYYGTFQGNPSFPQPVHPSQAAYPPLQHQQQEQGYPSAQGYGRIEEGIPVCHHDHRDRLPCCGLGMGWILFILGFFTLSIPWFVGAFLFFCFRHDPREHVGLGACALAALIAFLLGGTKGAQML